MKINHSVCTLLLLIGSIQNSFGQYEPPTNKNNSVVDNPLTADKPVHFFYLGIGSGIYSKYGIIGLAVGTRISQKTIAEAQFGLGGWGSKIGISLTTNVKNVNSWCPSIGFGRNFGSQALAFNPEVVLNGGSPFKVDANVNYVPINVLYLSLQRQFLSKKGNRFVLELGYTVPLSETKVEFSDPTVRYNGNIIPTSDLIFSPVQKTAFNIQSPSGILISASYHFGFGKFN
ncbi:MAG: hypothetical protein H7296_11450 [Bacteroidia bacterium]|nr:hypothetical protein [Bacteroidia bacterium]